MQALSCACISFALRMTISGCGCVTLWLIDFWVAGLLLWLAQREKFAGNRRAGCFMFSSLCCQDNPKRLS